MRFVTAAALLVLAGAAPGQAKTIDKHFHQTFPVQGGALLRLSHGDGDVDITPWDRDEVDVDIVYRADYTMVGVGREPDFEAELSQDGPVIKVEGRETGVAMVGIFLSTDVKEYRYTIHAPASLAVESHGVDGDLQATGLRGDVRCRVVDGDITLTDVQCDRISVSAEDGDIRLADLRGAVDIDAEDGTITGERIAATDASVDLEDGDIHLRNCSGDWDVRIEDGATTMLDQAAGQLSLHGEDGDVTLELVPGGKADVKIEVADGDVEIGVDPGVSTAFLLSTDDGRVRVEADGVKNLQQDGDRVYGEVGSAEGAIRAHAEDGRVSLRVARAGA